MPVIERHGAFPRRIGRRDRIMFLQAFKVGYAVIADQRGRRQAVKAHRSPQRQRPAIAAVQNNRCRPYLVKVRSEEHTSELQSLMRISYAVFCLKKKKKTSMLTSTAMNGKQ